MFKEHFEIMGRTGLFAGIPTLIACALALSCSCLVCVLLFGILKGATMTEPASSPVGTQPVVIKTFTPKPITIAPTTIPLTTTSIPVTEPSRPMPVLPTQAPEPTLSDVRIVAVDKQDEFVDIRNDGDQAQDLGGWVLLSEKGDQRCTLGGILNPTETLRVWAMAEDAGQGGYNCGFDTTIWNNSEPDPAALYDAAGTLVSRWSPKP